MSDYNGWTNYETWNLNLWASNEQPTLKFVAENKPYDSTAKAIRIALELFPDGTPDMNGAGDFDTVDWGEIMAAWNEYE